MNCQAPIKRESPAGSKGFGSEFFFELAVDSAAVPQLPVMFRNKCPGLAFGNRILDAKPR